MDFFNRRIKRIIPNVFFVSSITLLLSWFILLPNDFANVIESYLYTSLYLANFFFMYSTSGYFSSSSDEMPLLHMWSLSVEEQYYFIWPFLLLMIINFFNKKHIGFILLFLSILSFLYSEYMITKDQTFSYYMLPSRAGGLLLGSSIALFQNFNNKLLNINSSLVTLIGIILIILSSIMINDGSRFPGIISSIPCIGAILVIIGGTSEINVKKNVISRMIGIKPISFLGMLSFSIYLWHWPLISLSNYLNIKLEPLVILIIVISTIIFSYISLKLIENPIRKSKSNFIKSLIIYNILFIIIGFGLNVTSKKTNGFDFRFDNKMLEIGKFDVSYAGLDTGWCHVSAEGLSGIKFTNELANCFIGDKSATQQALYIGDSTAGHYGPFVDEMAREAKIKVRQLSTSSCYPTTEVKGEGENHDVCKNFREIIMKEVSSNKYDIIILSNRWVRDNSITSYKSSYINDIFSFYSKHAKKIIVLSQLQEWDIDPATCIARKTCNMNDKFNVLESIDKARLKLKDSINKFDNIILVDPYYLLMKDGVYTPFAMGYPMYHDKGHLSIKGMKWIAYRYLKDNKNPLK